MVFKNGIAYVILHYQNINDTLDCIQSIKENDSGSKIIVISNSQDFENLKIIKKEVDFLIKNKENVGFAKANNIACNYAIKHFNPDFLCVINNDIVITQDDFRKKIETIYLKEHFDCLGPKIITSDGDSVNPFTVFRTEEEISQAIKRAEKSIRIYSSFILRNLFYLYLKFQNKKKKLLKNGEKSEKDVALHGCALIFSRQYYTKYDTVFYDETFLYHEEEFLDYRRRKDGLTFVYDPQIEVNHKEGASLSYSYNKNYQKLIFRNTEIIKSLHLLLELEKSRGIIHEKNNKTIK